MTVTKATPADAGCYVTGWWGTVRDRAHDHAGIDSKTVGVVDGFDITAGLVHDSDTTVDDFDCYDEKAIAAYYRDEWHYVGIIITASKAGVVLGESSLWGSEYGILPDVDGWVSPLDGDGENFVNGYGPELIAEAIAEAQAKIKELIEK